MTFPEQRISPIAGLQYFLSTRLPVRRIHSYRISFTISTIHSLYVTIVIDTLQDIRLYDIFQPFSTSSSGNRTNIQTYLRHLLYHHWPFSVTARRLQKSTVSIQNLISYDLALSHDLRLKEGQQFLNAP